MSADDLFKQFFGEDFDIFGGSGFSNHPFFSKTMFIVPCVNVVTVGDSPRAGHRQRSSQQGGGGFFGGFSGFGDMGFSDMGFSSFGGGGGAMFTSYRLVTNHTLKMKILGTPPFPFYYFAVEFCQQLISWNVSDYECFLQFNWLWWRHGQYERLVDQFYFNNLMKHNHAVEMSSSSTSFGPGGHKATKRVTKR